ncbi:MAG: hypothetical protein RR215_01405 [Ruthenibacterium sp.]
MTKRQTIGLVGGLYGAVLACCVLLSLLHFAQDSFDRKSGALATCEMTFSDFEGQDAEPVEGQPPDTVRVTASEDPQLVLADLSKTGRVRDVHFDIAFSKDPGEVTLYYAAAGELFSNDKKVWGVQQNDGSYAFTLPRKDIGCLRIDPTNQTDVTMVLHSFTLNAPRAFLDYFAFSADDVFRFIVYPGLAAAFLGYCINELGSVLRKKRAAGKEGKE